ncbi:MAG: hypothetical protein JJ979_27625 [Roseibium sp.]|nr:hypothetical protein [Roseibium sp.]
MNKPDTAANAMAEKAVLGAVLSGPEAYFSVAEVLQPQHFYRRINAEIFEAVRDIHNSGRKFSLHRVVASVGDEFEDGKSTISYLTAMLRDSDDNELNPLDFVEDIIEAWQRRKIADLQAWATKEVTKQDVIPTDLLNNWKERIDAIQQNSQTVPLMKIGEYAKRAVAASAKAQETGDVVGYDTGLPTLDELCGRFFPGDLIVLGASQGDAKTVMAAQIARHQQKYGPIIFFQGEMRGEDMARRALAGDANTSVSSIEEGSYDFWQLEELQKAEQNIQAENVYLWQRSHMEPRLNLELIRSKCRQMKQSRGLIGIFVDHILLVKTRREHRSYFDRVAEVTETFKELAGSLDIFVVGLAQRTRSAQRRADPSPQINDFDGGSSIERDADLVWGQFRRDRWLSGSRPHDQESKEFNDWIEEYRKAKGKIEINTMKRRRGDDGEMREFLFNGKAGRIEEL